MKFKGKPFLIATILLAVFVVAPLQDVLAQKKNVTLRDVFMNPAFFAPRISGFAWMPDGEHYTYIKADPESGARQIWKVDAKSGDEQLFLDASTLTLPSTGETLTFEDFRWEQNGDFIVFTISERPIWRRSTIGTYAVYHVPEGKLISLPEHEEGVMNVKVSPDGAWVGYVYADNIHIMNLTTGKEIQLTDDVQEHVHNGRFGWVYEEEFSIVDGWQWSPDSRRIAFWQEDERQVPEFMLTNWMPLYQDYVRIRYPKPGERNPIERIGVIDLATREHTWMDLGEDTDIYIPRIRWTRDPETLCIYRMNRLQNHLELLFADVTTGATRVVLEDRSQTGWISVDDGSWLHFLTGSDHFIWASERDGWNHLYVFDSEGKQIRQLTSGEWEVVDVQGISADQTTVFFTSTAVSPTQEHLYAVEVDGGKPIRLTGDEGWHSVSLSPTGAFFVDSWSSTRQPTRRVLRDADGDEVRNLGEVDPAVFDDYYWSEKELTTITTPDGWTLDVSIMKPADFDPSKTYPVFFDVYGGPGTSAVRNSWPGTMQQWYTSEGYIVVQVDNRGSSRRGTAFKHAVYMQLGKWEVRDYVEVARHLAELPYVDADRIGIWGWSYGGYMAALSLLLGEGTFSTGVAIAPLCDWRLYDTIYAERYMQRPKDNPDGYDVGSCIVHADKLQGNLLLIHGGLDDNVHVQNTMQFIDRLEEAGKQFDMRIYPNGDHGVAGGMRSRLGLFEYYMSYMNEHMQNR
ncbi:MAG: S9 family peptidase [Bacteroidetes bacterium]|nr:S9 family peptidase [Bacteroidota bacterium]